MRFFISAVLISTALVAQPALAQMAPDAPTPELLPPAGETVAPDQQPAEAILQPNEDGDTLARLFRQLRRARDADEAAAFAKRIDDTLDLSPSATVSLLIKWSDDAENDGRTASALDFLSEAIALRPDEPAAYRKRAVIHYTHGDINRAMDDIRSALDLEPRDIGALGLMATILDQAGRQQAAVAVWRRYLELYPADRDVSSYVDRTENEIAGERL
ncbi:tetratricopeptide repeat protein [Martelella endophytica]|nr:hypothetical protein [Martelella endophytica]